ncbi:multiple sugar transport system permease protein [Thermosporothrix hazakensis]|uniref:Multiple sugar transport system permease protein n=1 Tax=Thermosporothrix hazakensis TaxID=644383 RepID=A0A326U4E1_THEHA|nr:carbohydrate ABC transporter permease [Thermosporothrix hazakensis]PZW27908.1 multiple sugar transport system permease protein [Thermosporothrix hazakensis]GCE51133.1 sugar ABC transporter permease [Thermosporothrix hazakensis]
MKSALSMEPIEQQDLPPVKREGYKVSIWQKIWDSIVARIFLVVMSVLFLIPLYWMVATALKSNEEMSVTPPTFIPQSWLWENFVKAVTIIPFGTFFMNSLLITVLTVIGTVVSNLIVAYGFSCIQWKGRDQLFYLVLITLFVPFPIALIPQFDLFAWLGWVNTYLPLIVPHFLASAFSTFLLRQFLLQIPQDMLDAARVDGASEWRILWTIVAPTARPALATVAIFAAIGAWNDFMGPLIYLQDESLQTLSIGLQMFRSTHDIQFNLLMAASVLIILPIMVLFFAFQRFFIKGITVGSFR